MRDTRLVVGATLCAVSGVIALCILAQGVHPTRIDIASLNPGAYVGCEGIVYEVRRSGEHLFVNIFDGSSVTVPFFNCEDDISRGDLLYVEGTVSVYKGELEIIPTEYRVSTILYGKCLHSQFYTSRGVFHAELSDGVHAVTGTIRSDSLTVERELSLPLVPFQGRICTTHHRGEAFFFTLFGDTRHFSAESSLELGEISGVGIQVGGDIIVFYSEWAEFAPEPIAEAIQRPEGYPVKVCGTIESVRTSQGHVFFLIRDPTGRILVPVFKGNQSTLKMSAETLTAGQRVTVVGTIKYYEGSPEILPVMLHA